MSWDPEALTEECNAMMRASSSRNPLEFPWGLFAWADAPAGIGGGIGAFQWFQELNQVLDHVTDLSAAGFATFDEEDEWLELRNGLREIGAGFSVGPDAVIQAFNIELASLLQIDWIGSLDNLMAANEPFPVMLRSYFRGDWDDAPAEESQLAIQEEEKDSFLAFLSDYGH